MKKLLALAAAALLAAASGARAEDLVPYEVRPGDTLYGVAERLLLEGARGWPLLQRINGVANPRQLVPGSTLRLPAERLRGTPQTLQVAYARGRVVAAAADGSERALGAGDTLQEGETVWVQDRSFATLRQRDGSEVQLPAGSRLRLLHLREIDGADRSRSVFELEGGRVDAAVQPQRPGSRYEVRTPLAIAGVRGTRFGVALSPAGTVSDVTEGVIGVAAAQAAATPVPVRAGQGAVVGAGAGVSVVDLLPAPDLSGQPQRQEDMPWSVPLPPLAPDAGAARYSVQVAREGAAAQVLEAIDAVAAPVVIGGLPDGRYLLRVRAIDARGLPGAVAERGVRVKTRPVAPLVQSPAAGQLLPLGTVHLACTDVYGAEGYLLQLARTPDFAAPAEQRAERACGFDIRVEEEGAYYWRVASLAREAAGAPPERGPYSALESFHASALPPAPGAGMEQEDGADGQRIRWKPVPGARYVVEVAQEGDADFAHPVQRLEVDEAEARLRLPATCGGRYAVRLQAIAANGLRSEFSPPRWLRAPQSLCTGQGLPVGSGAGMPWSRP
ncbi:FecR domain-containing protein [Ramlibacter sp. H39-3-26]|uniref:FecR domain-containing protein n=1 Tax=Curvibacter soli TaxID=3031331 RepID=UPI0023DA62AF|nr:FecR domain-containing protein [Ramlibacter sp. H39-3-26]MDF1483877.1 FecR domain-containing protein [Ramlibacter sp. H39-3-26]